MNDTITPKQSGFSKNGGPVGRPLSYDEIITTVKLGLKRGTIHAPGQALAIEKNGFDLANLDKVRAQWLDVTPEMATRWLRNNFRNRPLREDTVRAYARDMLNGAWVPTHQGIAFNDKDELIDGQHRLSAIVLAKKTIRMMVTFGLPSVIAGHGGRKLEMTTMDAVDRGATRSVADQLTIQHGFKHGSVTASVCAALASLCCVDRMRRLSVGQTLEVYREFETPASYVIEHRARQVGLRSAGVLAGFAFALATEEGYWDRATPIARMFLQVMTGEGIQEGTAAKRLRDFLTSDEAKLFSPALNRGLAELTLEAVRLELRGEKVTQLAAVLTGAEHFRTVLRAKVDKVAAIFRLPDEKRGSM